MRRIGFLSAALAFFAVPVASEVTLELGDGTVVLTGELLNFDDGSYEIQTLFGTFSVPIDLAICTGDCPVFEEPIGTEVRIVTVAPFGAQLMDETMAAFIAQSGAVVESPASFGALPTGNVLAGDGTLLAELSTRIDENTAAFQALLNDEADIIFTDRRISEAEVEAFLDAGLGDLTDASLEKIFGGDGAALVVPVVNPVETLTPGQAAGIFSGEITNWNQVGGPDLPINVLAPAESSAAGSVFEEQVLLPNFATYGNNVDRSKSVREIASAVAGDPFAIGVTKFTTATAGRIMPITASCGIQYRPDDFAVASEDYPLAARFYAYTTNRGAPDMVAQLANFMQEDGGQTAVARSGFVNLETREADLNTFGQRLAYALSDRDLAAEIPNLSAFAREVVSADRLSTTFRFDTGSSQLDNKALADVQRLAALLNQPQYAGAEVLLIGFTDSIGRSGVNKLLSERRSAEVLDEVRALAGDALAGVQITSLGFGAANPVACNDEAIGRDLNRRVEVWIR